MVYIYGLILAPEYRKTVDFQNMNIKHFVTRKCTNILFCDLSGIISKPSWEIHVFQFDTCFKEFLDTEKQCSSNKAEKTPAHLKTLFKIITNLVLKHLEKMDFKKEACSVLGQLLVFDQFHFSLLNSFPSPGIFLLRYCIAVLILSYESLLPWSLHL